MVFLFNSGREGGVWGYSSSTVVLMVLFSSRVLCVFFVAGVTP